MEETKMMAGRHSSKGTYGTEGMGQACLALQGRDKAFKKVIDSLTQVLFISSLLAAARRLSENS